MKKHTKEFAGRLHQALDDLGIPAENRASFLAKMFGLTAPACRRWLNGLNYPETYRLVALANKLQVNIVWLLDGVGEKKESFQRINKDLLQDIVRETISVKEVQNIPAEELAEIIVDVYEHVSELPQPGVLSGLVSFLLRKFS